MRNGIIISFSLLGLIAWSASEAQSDAPAPKAAGNSWVSVSGTVAALGESSFELAYDGGLLTVSLDGWRLNDQHRYALMQGGRVLVSAKVGPEFFPQHRVRATSLYLERAALQLYASGQVDDDFVPTVSLDDAPRIQLVGTVDDVSGWDFHLQTSAGPIEVDTRQVAPIHLSEVEYELLRAGDRVRLSAVLSEAVFDGILRAQLITRL